MNADPKIHLLWTGGWDSTFRLLNLLLVHRVPVQPYYLIDLERRGFADEIRAMGGIRQALLKDSRLDPVRLAPTVIFERSQLADDQELTQAMRRLRGNGRVGLQYDWMIRFARQYCPAPLELSIHKDDKAHAVLEESVVREETPTGRRARVSDSPSNPDFRIFSVFHFPLFDLTKRDMQDTADKHGFREFMEMTWFCHSPLPNGEPCGTCSPCIYAREEGLGRRIPLRGKMREKLHSVRRKLLK